MANVVGARPPLQPVESLNSPVWYRSNDSDCTVVFVHGFRSGNLSCWLKPEPDAAFWPDLVLSDPRLQSPAVMLAGFETRFDSGDYGVGEAADSIFHALRRPDGHGGPPPLERKRLIFVCHSTGGIVVRRMLTAYTDAFRLIHVGLALIASPSLGSHFASTAWPFLRLLGLRLGEQLAWRSETLRDLDQRFFRLVQGEWKLPRLDGIEGIEHRPILPSWIPTVLRPIVPGWLMVVTPSSGRRYFATDRTLVGTDHFSAAKPDSIDHESHNLLRDVFDMIDRAAARDREALPTFLGSREVPGTDANRLFFGARAHAFVGREEELAQLRTFLTTAAPFSWWAVRGPAGSGKSRVALELCREVAKEWHAGFLIRGQHGSLASFTAERPLLAVVDYVVGQEDATHAMLRTLAERQHSLKGSIRILILERDGSSEVMDRVYGSGGDRHLVESAKYAEADLHLARLGTDDLCSIARERGPGDRPDLRDRIEQLADGRPLMAALLGEVLPASSDEGPHGLTRLLRTFLEREDAERWQRVGLDDRYRCLLAFATILDGLDVVDAFDDPAIAKWIPTRSTYEPDVVNAAFGTDARAVVAPVRPALVGEFFVLDLLRPRHAADADRLDAWRRWIWSRFDDARGFLFRCQMDFPDDEILQTLIEAPPDAAVDAREWSAHMLNATLVGRLARGEWHAADGLLARLDRVAGESEQESIVNNLRVLGHLWRAGPEAAEGRPDGARARIERWTGHPLTAKSIRETGWALDPMFVSPVSGALGALVEAYRSAGNQTAMLESFACLAEMAAASRHREPLDRAVGVMTEVVIALASPSHPLNLDLVIHCYSKLRPLGRDYVSRPGLLLGRPVGEDPSLRFERSMAWLGGAIAVDAARKGRQDDAEWACKEVGARSLEMPADGIVSNVNVSTVLALWGPLSRNEEPWTAGLDLFRTLLEWSDAVASSPEELDPSDPADLHFGNAMSLVASFHAGLHSHPDSPIDPDRALDMLARSRSWLRNGSRTLFDVSAPRVFGVASGRWHKRLLEMGRSGDALQLLEWMYETVWRCGVPPTEDYLSAASQDGLTFGASSDLSYLDAATDITNKVTERLKTTAVDRDRWR